MREISAIENFGAVDADNDSLLFECFEDHEAYDNLLQRKRFLILGRKGAGKTAIFKKLLATRKFHLFSYGHTFTDYPWEHHAKQKRTGTPEAEAYIHSWTYLILMSLAKICLNMDSSLPYKDSDMDTLLSIERFVIDSYGSRDPDLTQIFRPQNVLKVKPHLSFALGPVQAGATVESIKTDELPRFIAEINKTVTNSLLETANPAHEYHVCFDQLDLDFDPGSTDYKQRLIGLILAARRLNIRARELGRKVFASIFLRSDIYDVLQFEDKNKITENDSTRIEWDTEQTNHTLRELMERRFTEVLGEKVTWDMVFSGKEMTSRQRQYDYILARTYSRPRDMIKFCNEVLASYKRRLVQSPSLSKQFVNDDILNARGDYSIYFINEIDDELHKQMPQYKKYLEFIKALGFYQFERKSFDETFERRSQEFEIEESGRDVLMALYRASLIGFRKTGGRSGGSGWVFSYLDPKARFDEEANLLRVHYGLIEALDLKRQQRSSSAADADEYGEEL